MIIGLVGLSRSMAVQYLWSSRHGRPAEGRVRLIYLICLAFRDYVRMLRSWYHRGEFVCSIAKRDQCLSEHLIERWPAPPHPSTHGNNLKIILYGFLFS